MICRQVESDKTQDIGATVSDHDESRARLAAIVDSSDDAIVSKTLDGIITSWNKSAERLFGYAASEAIGQSIFIIIPADRRDEEAEVLARLRRGERTDHFETVRQAKDGRLIPVSLTISPVRNARGTIVGASKVARDITERVLAQEALRRARDELEERVKERTADLSRANQALRIEIEQRQAAQEQRRQLFTRLVLAEEDERRRIARDLHDQLGQQMTALRLTLETLKVFAVERPELETQVDTLRELTRQLDQDIAFRVWELRPTVLDNLGLAAALTEHAGNWSKRFGIHAELHVTRPADERLQSETETTIYRFAQEALNNVVKHSRASRVDIVLEQGPAHVSLIVEDNGIGFDASTTTPRGLGLIGMHERAALIDADLQVESAPGKGTTIVLRVPVASAVTAKNA
jgi:PAS domain S-box-containing protein